MVAETSTSATSHSDATPPRRASADTTDSLGRHSRPNGPAVPDETDESALPNLIVHALGLLGAAAEVAVPVEDPLVATAVDILSNGKAQYHYCHEFPERGCTPYFDCSPSSDSVRIIFYDTAHVNPPNPDTTFRSGNEELSVIDCDHCEAGGRRSSRSATPRSGTPSTKQSGSGGRSISASRRIPRKPSTITNLSPGTRTPLPQDSKTRNSRSRSAPSRASSRQWRHPSRSPTTSRRKSGSRSSQSHRRGSYRTRSSLSDRRRSDGSRSRHRSRSRSRSRRRSRSRSCSPSSTSTRNRSKRAVITRPHPSRSESRRSDNSYDALRSQTRFSGELYDSSSSNFSGTRSERRRKRAERKEAKKADAVWKAYRGATSVDPLKLFSLWRPRATNTNILVGINVMFDTDNDIGEIDDTVWRKRIKDERHTLTLNGSLWPFYTVPNLFRWYRAPNPSHNCLEIEARFFSTIVSRRFFLADLNHSPLRDYLWTRVTEHNSAVEMHSGNMELASRLITFDILEASVECWIDFLRFVREKAAWQPRSFGAYEGFEDQIPLVGDREHIADFGRAIRDLVQGLEICIDAIDLQQKFDDGQQQQWAFLKLQSQTRRSVMQNIMKDIEEYIDGFVSRGETLIGERQEASLNILTIVASIFLPLTMACSLLSMSNRVNSIGVLWWDWLGVVLIIGIVVLFGFQVSRKMHQIRRQPRLQWILRTLKEEFERAKTKALEAEKKKPYYLRQSRLVPFVPRFLWWISRYIFLIGAVVSFLLGMFYQHGNVAIGAESLGYSAAGTVAIFFGGILSWRLLKAAWWLIRHSRKKDDKPDKKIASNKPSKKNGSENPARSSTDRYDSERTRVSERRRKKKRNPILRFLLKLIALFAFSVFIPSTIFIVGFLYSTFTFFFGSLLLKTLSHMMLKVIQIFVPDNWIEKGWNGISKWLSHKAMITHKTDVEEGADDERSDADDDDEKTAQARIDEKLSKTDKLEINGPLGPVALRSTIGIKRAETFAGQQGVKRTGTGLSPTVRIKRAGTMDFPQPGVKMGSIKSLRRTQTAGPRDRPRIEEKKNAKSSLQENEDEN